MIQTTLLRVKLSLFESLTKVFMVTVRFSRQNHWFFAIIVVLSFRCDFIQIQRFHHCRTMDWPVRIGPKFGSCANFFISNGLSIFLVLFRFYCGLTVNELYMSCSWPNQNCILAIYQSFIQGKWPKINYSNRLIKKAFWSQIKSWMIPSGRDET